MDGKRVSVLVLGSALVIAGGVVVSSALLSRFALKVEKSCKTECDILVKGVAEKDVTSDVGAFTCQLNCKAKDISSGYAELNRLTALLDGKFRETGISQDWVENVSIHYFAVNKMVRVKENNQVTTREEFSHYQFSRSCRVRSKEVKTLENASVKLYELTASGVDISVSRVEYFVSDLEKYKLELIDSASKAAYERAKVVAKQCGAQLGPLKNARQGVIQITKPASDETSDGGVYDTSTIKKVMRLVVTMNFALR